MRELRGDRISASAVWLGSGIARVCSMATTTGSDRENPRTGVGEPPIGCRGCQCCDSWYATGHGLETIVMSGPLPLCNGNQLQLASMSSRDA